MPPADESAASAPNPPLASGEDRSTTQPTLHTARLTLAPLTDEHLELEVELDSDAEVMRYLTGRALSRAEVERAHQRRIAAARKVPGLGFWTGFDRGDFIGWWILQPPHGPVQPEVAGEADLGFRLLRRHWRRGYAAEGARELIRYGFGGVGLNRIFAQTMAVNTPSRATLAAVGRRGSHLRRRLRFRRPVRRSRAGRRTGRG
jgi:RimJ/RimL family protein N-acetyltransferase